MWPFNPPPELPEGPARLKNGQEVTLVLYKFDTCPYCQVVLRFLKKHPVPMKFRDTREDPGAAQELIQIGGKQQVPCLVIDGKALYESSDIVDYLATEFDPL